MRRCVVVWSGCGRAGVARGNEKVRVNSSEWRCNDRGLAGVRVPAHSARSKMREEIDSKGSKTNGDNERQETGKVGSSDER